MRFALFALALAGCEAHQPDPFKEAEAAVRSQMRDPASAEFRSLKRQAEQKIVCGEVNGRNGYNGKTGFIPFKYEEEAKTVMFANPDATDQQDLLNTVSVTDSCR